MCYFCGINERKILKLYQYEKTNEGSSSHSANDGGGLHRWMHET